MFSIPDATQAFWSRLGLKPASEAQIIEVAGLAPGALPDDYVAFLKVHGFARWMLTVPDRFRYRQSLAGQGIERVGSITHLENPESLRRAAENAWTDQPEVGLPCWPRGVMPVAGNAGYGQILMDFTETPGAILYWEPSEYPWGEGSNTKLWRIAPNFTYFINGLLMRDQI
jgi:hypothetical protein